MCVCVCMYVFDPVKLFFLNFFFLRFPFDFFFRTISGHRDRGEAFFCCCFFGISSPFITMMRARGARCTVRNQSLEKKTSEQSFALSGARPTEEKRITLCDKTQTHDKSMCDQVLNTNKSNLLVASSRTPQVIGSNQQRMRQSRNRYWPVRVQRRQSLLLLWCWFVFVLFLCWFVGVGTSDDNVSCDHPN